MVERPSSSCALPIYGRGQTLLQMGGEGVMVPAAHACVMTLLPSRLASPPRWRAHFSLPAWVTITLCHLAISRVLPFPRPLFVFPRHSCDAHISPPARRPSSRPLPVGQRIHTHTHTHTKRDALSLPFTGPDDPPPPLSFSFWAAGAPLQGGGGRTEATPDPHVNAHAHRPFPIPTAPSRGRGEHLK